MSTRAWGKIHFSEKLTVLNQIEVSYFLLAESVKQKIGIRFGGNVSKDIHDFENISQNDMLFELSDDPLDINCDMLFGMEISYNDCDNATFLNRMARLQKIVNTIFSQSNVLSVNLKIIADGYLNNTPKECYSLPFTEVSNYLAHDFKKQNEINSHSFTPYFNINLKVTT